uniref:Uncharacterized protein n=1 Tax=Daphnia magna TaxID=35525 RepID=A0A0P6IQB4_9CRUS
MLKIFPFHLRNKTELLVYICTTESTVIRGSMIIRILIRLICHLTRPTKHESFFISEISAYWVDHSSYLL